MTSPGALRSEVVPSPSWPALFRPQHLTPPAWVRAHVCESVKKPPASTSAMFVRLPAHAAFAHTSTGVADCRIALPTPSCPSSLLPQHFTPPLVKRAQVCVDPSIHNCHAITQPHHGLGNWIRDAIHRSEAQATLLIRSPTVHCATGGQRTCVRTRSPLLPRNRDRVHVLANLNGRGNGSQGRRTIAQFTCAVPPPALCDTRG